MQAKLTLQVAGDAEGRARHDYLQLLDQVLYGFTAGDAQGRRRGRSLLLQAGGVQKQVAAIFIKTRYDSRHKEQRR